MKAKGGKWNSACVCLLGVAGRVCLVAWIMLLTSSALGAPKLISEGVPLLLRNGMSVEGGHEGVLIAGSRSIFPQWATVDESEASALRARLSSTVIDRFLVNGAPQPMARFPDFDGDARHWNGVSGDATSEVRIGSWTNPIGGYLHAMHRSMWGDFHYRITGKDAKGELILEGGWQNNRQMGMHQHYRFVEGIREELDAPSSWWEQRRKSAIYWIQDVCGPTPNRLKEGESLSGCDESTRRGNLAPSAEYQNSTECML
ncbi:MAG: hypothetical protein ACI8W8_002813 [Rhodothermales bacterium]|jgi:hypothetical protein